MKKIIVLSVDENPKYLYTLPLVVWSWIKFGWTPLIIQNLKPSALDFLVGRTISALGKVRGTIIQNIPGYRPETIAQVSRLYAAVFTGENTYVMTGDADMMALSDYWNPADNEKITIWGHDLTDYQQVPICYVGMKTKVWRETMVIRSSDIQGLMERDLEIIGGAKENDEQVNRWCSDQRIITAFLKASDKEKIFIDRGVYETGYPIGRIDRSAWGYYTNTGSRMHTSELIDCHLPHDIYTNGDSFAKVLKMLMQVFPKDNFDWFIEYTKNFIDLAK